MSELRRINPSSEGEQRLHELRRKQEQSDDQARSFRWTIPAAALAHVAVGVGLTAEHDGSEVKRELTAVEQVVQEIRERNEQNEATAEYLQQHLAEYVQEVSTEYPKQGKIPDENVYSHLDAVQLAQRWVHVAHKPVTVEEALNIVTEREQELLRLYNSRLDEAIALHPVFQEHEWTGNIDEDFEALQSIILDGDHAVIADAKYQKNSPDFDTQLESDLVNCQASRLTPIVAEDIYTNLGIEYDLSNYRVAQWSDHVSSATEQSDGTVLVYQDLGVGLPQPPEEAGENPPSIISPYGHFASYVHHRDLGETPWVGDVTNSQLQPYFSGEIPSRIMPLRKFIQGDFKERAQEKTPSDPSKDSENYFVPVERESLEEKFSIAEAEFNAQMNGILRGQGHAFIEIPPSIAQAEYDDLRLSTKFYLDLTRGTNHVEEGFRDALLDTESVWTSYEIIRAKRSPGNREPQIGSNKFAISTYILARLVEKDPEIAELVVKAFTGEGRAVAFSVNRSFDTATYGDGQAMSIWHIGTMIKNQIQIEEILRQTGDFEGREVLEAALVQDKHIIATSLYGSDGPTMNVEEKLRYGLETYEGGWVSFARLELTTADWEEMPDDLFKKLVVDENPHIVLRDHNEHRSNQAILQRLRDQYPDVFKSTVLQMFNTGTADAVTAVALAAQELQTDTDFRNEFMRLYIENTRVNPKVLAMMIRKVPEFRDSIPTEVQRSDIEFAVWQMGLYENSAYVDDNGERHPFPEASSFTLQDLKDMQVDRDEHFFDSAALNREVRDRIVELYCTAITKSDRQETLWLQVRLGFDKPIIPLELVKPADINWYIHLEWDEINSGRSLGGRNPVTFLKVWYGEDTLTVEDLIVKRRQVVDEILDVYLLKYPESAERLKEEYKQQIQR